MDSLSNLISILQTNQTHKNSVAIIPYSKFSEAFLAVLLSERLINGYTIKYTTANAIGYISQKHTSCYQNDSVHPTPTVKKCVIGNENYQWKKKNFLVFLKYEKGVPGLQRCIRISTPGRRVYCNTDFLKKNTKGFHILFLSTSCGILSHRKAKALGVGGELLCKILL